MPTSRPNPLEPLVQLTRPTLANVARAAGVSTATVDRVLNSRDGVKARTRDLVLDTARRLGYVAELAPTAPAPITLDIVLPAGSNTFMLRLGDEMRQQALERSDVTVRMHLVEGFDPPTLAKTLGEIAEDSSGVGVVAIDHPIVRDAIRALSQRGVPIITLVSDIQNVPRAGYVGIDNRTAGRVAGYLVSRFLGPGHHKVALFAGSISYRGHEEREMGFRHIVSEHRDQLEVVGFTEIRDDDERAYAAASSVLAAHTDLAAIYNIGAGNRGIARALNEAERSAKVVFVGHDLTEHTQNYLRSGVMDAVIDQNPRIEAREALDQLVRLSRGLNWSAGTLRTQIILKENIPEAFY